MTVPSSVLATFLSEETAFGRFLLLMCNRRTTSFGAVAETNLFVPGRPLFLLVFTFFPPFGRVLVQSLSEIRLESTWRLHCQLTPQGIRLEGTLKVCSVSSLTLKKSIGGD